VHVTWDADRLADFLPKRPTGQCEVEEARIDAKFPPDHKGLLVVEPAIIVERHSRILAWCLPDGLSKKRQVSVLAAVYKTCLSFT